MADDTYQLIPFELALYIVSIADITARGMVIANQPGGWLAN